MQGLAIGIDLGGTNLKIGLVDRSGRIAAAKSFPTQAQRGPDHVIGFVGEVVDSLIAHERIPQAEVIGVGVGTPGPLDLASGTMIKTANLPGWTNVPLRDRLRSRLAMPVVLENDANAAAYGEFWAGAGRGTPNLVLLTLGTGVGGGVILDGRILHGHFDNAAELGHMIVVAGGLPCGCGQRGCLEAYASAGAVARRVAEAIRKGERCEIGADSLASLNAKTVAAHARTGDDLCAKIWDEACFYIAIACINIQHAFNPQVVLLGGGMMEAGDFLLRAVVDHVQRLRWSLHEDLPRILPAALGPDAGLIGAAGLAWRVAEERNGIHGTSH